MSDRASEVENLLRQLYQSPREVSDLILKRLAEDIDRNSLLMTIHDLLVAPGTDQRLWLTTAYAVAKIDPQAANEFLILFLTHHDQAKRYEAAGILGDIGTPTAVESLMQVLKNDPDPSIRHLSAFSLGKLGDRRAIELLQWVRENDPGVDFDGHDVATAASDAIESILSGRCRS